MNASARIAVISLIGATITVAGSIVVAKITTKNELNHAGSQIAALSDKAESIKTTLDYIAVPPGTIIAFGGPLNPDALSQQGWLPCDGHAVSRDKYKDLFARIGQSWGNGDGVNTFNLPDLRGVFLRGVNGDRQNTFPGGSGLMDSDANDRVSLVNGANAKNNVGSSETDMVGPHSHVLRAENVLQQGGAYTSPFANEKDGNGHQTTDTGTGIGKETRPKNAYVYYLIKY